MRFEPKIQRYHSKLLLACALAGLVVPFQNCSQVAFEATEKASVQKELSGPQYEEVTAGKDQTFPPLKLIFVVDNSGTMAANQINLSQSFARMFEGSNATNLEKFEASAFIINTAQNSLAPSDSAFSRLPTRSIASIAELPIDQISRDFRGRILSGAVPGDLVGYHVQDQIENGLVSVSFLPAPLATFSQGTTGSVGSISIRKQLGSPVGSFAEKFGTTLSLLDPTLSEMYVATSRGVLDRVIDQESGLCAIARILDRPSGIIEPGDLAAFIVVSDEDDQDPSGVKCISSFKERLGNEEMIDGRCDQVQTALTHRPPKTSPRAASCKVGFQTGFEYKLVQNIPRTDIAYYRRDYKYEQRRTKVSFHRARHSWKKNVTTVTFSKSNPTYEVPRTKVTYFTETESCLIRDGIKSNCTYTYPRHEISLKGAFNSDCVSFARNKLPTEALFTKSNYLPVCAAEANLKVSGACSERDSSILNCKQNISRESPIELDGAPDSSGCLHFAQNRLGSGAIYTSSGPNAVLCGTTSRVLAGSANGLCPVPEGQALDCKNDFLAGEETHNGLVGSMSCENYAKSKISDAVTTVDGFNPVCTEAASSNEIAIGSCPTGIDKQNCVLAPSLRSARLSAVPATLTSSGCRDFAKSNLSPHLNAVLDDSSFAPTCTSAPATTKNLAGSESFAKAEWSSLVFTKGMSCADSVRSALMSKHAVTNASACEITGFTTGETTISSVCLQANSTLVCSSSSGAKRSCSTIDLAADDPFLAATTEIKSGEFNCSTPCSQTNFCSEKPGTVGENFHSCETKAAHSPVRSFTGEIVTSPGLCTAGQKLVVTKGPYRETGLVATHIGGESSANATPNALANYIRRRSEALFGPTMPAVSVFVRQPADTLGQNGSIGTAYNAFADLMGGHKRSALTDAEGYASSLELLSGEVRKRLDRSFAMKDMRPGQTIKRVWHRKSGQSDWGEALSRDQWSATDLTVSLLPSFEFEMGDEFRFEYE